MGNSQTVEVKRKRILVTGSAGGLGREIALRLAMKGAEVVLWDILQHGLEETMQLVKDQGGAEAEIHVVDLADPASIREAAKATGSVWGVVNNAGIVNGDRFLDSSDIRNELVFRINVMAHLYTAKCFLPYMIQNNDGCFVTVSSVASYIGAPRMVDYASSKAAARVFIETLAQEVAIQAPNVHVGVVCPSHISTELFKGFDVGNPVTPSLVAADVARSVVDDCIEKRHPLVIVPAAVRLGVVLQGIMPSRLWRKIAFREVKKVMNKHDMGHANAIFDKIKIPSKL